MRQNMKNLSFLLSTLALAVSDASTTLRVKSPDAEVIKNAELGDIRGLSKEETIQKAPQVKDIDEDFYTPFGGCIEGETNGIELGQSASFSETGSFLFATSFRDAKIYQWTRQGYILSYDFTQFLAAPGRLGYKGQMSSDGAWVIIGIPSDSSQGADTGSVQVFNRDSTGVWGQVGIQLNGASSGDQYGFSVAISSSDVSRERIVVGAPGGGYGHTYVRNLNDSVGWTLTDELGDNLPETGFGFAVGLSNDFEFVTGAVGAPFFNRNQGKARVYDFSQYEYAQQVSGNFPSSNWGAAVAVSGDGLTVAIGAPLIGYVRVYRYEALTNTWGQVGFDLIVLGEKFGTSLTLSRDGTKVFVGANENPTGGADAGAAYVFQYDPLPVGRWNPNGRFVQIGAPFTGDVSEELCGTSVAMSPDGKKFALICPGASGLDGGSTKGRICVYTTPLEPGDEGYIFPSTSPSSMPTLSPTISLSPTKGSTPKPSISFEPTDSPTENPTATPTKGTETDPGTGDPSVNPGIIMQILYLLFGMIITFIGGICAGGCVGSGYFYDCGYYGYGYDYGYGCCSGSDCGYYGSYCCYDWCNEPWFYHHSQQQQ